MRVDALPYICHTAMARTIRDPKLDSRTARLRLGVRREPYWTSMAPGCALGYRRGPGTWIAKYRGDDGQRHYEAIGPADDLTDGLGLSFRQAQERAREFYRLKQREAAGDFSPMAGIYTVADALREYFLDRERRGHKAVPRDRQSAEALIATQLGHIAVAKLTKQTIETWQHNLARSPARIRSRKGEQRFREHNGDPEAIRRRRVTVNRLLAMLRAALSLAQRNGRVAFNDAWQRVRAYENVVAARVRYLSEDESRRLINACSADFRSLVTASLLTGCRYGELARLTVDDFHPDAGTIHVRISKSGKPRHIALTEEGQRFFARLCAGRLSGALLLARDNGRPWQRSDQQRPMENACKVAKIENANFHALRHTYASRLVMRGVPLPVVAAQLGHSSIAMVEKHYGHLAPSYIAETVRQAFGELGIAEDFNIVPLQA
jgi:integrase